MRKPSRSLPLPWLWCIAFVVGCGSDVMPILGRAGCSAGTCHGNFNGKNGFRLSLRGENPAFDLASLTRDTQARRTNPLDPGASLLLLKPTGAIPHEGGIRF